MTAPRRRWSNRMGSMSDAPHDQPQKLSRVILGGVMMSFGGFLLIAAVAGAVAAARDDGGVLATGINGKSVLVAAELAVVFGLGFCMTALGIQKIRGSHPR